MRQSQNVLRRRELRLQIERSQKADAAFQAKVKAGVAAVVRKQAEIGIDIPSDGEFSKPTFTSYVSERLSGLGPTPPTAKPYTYAKLTEEFPGFKGERIVCSQCSEGISYRREVNQDGRILCRACAGESYFRPISE